MTTHPILPQTPFPLDKHLILLGKRGSEAYDLVLDPTKADHDLMGVAIPPLRYYFGLSQWEGAEAIKGSWDTVLYEVRKFVSLLCKQNPNVLELLWVADEQILHRPLEGTVLLENRQLFRHRDYARDAFVGYARSQLYKMEAFDVPTMEHISALETQLVEAGIDPQHVIADPPIQIEDMALAMVALEYASLRKKYRKAYMGQKRWDLVRRFQFDVKNACHMVRLLHMGFEYLTTGRLEVKRTWDREMLLEIKRGEWELQRVKEYAEAWLKKTEGVRSVLPTSIDTEAVETLLVGLVARQHWTALCDDALASESGGLSVTPDGS